MARPRFYLAVAIVTSLALSVPSAGAAALAPMPGCSGEPALVKQGQFGALSVDAFRPMSDALVSGDASRLRRLLHEGRIVPLPAQKVVCVLPNDELPARSSYVVVEGISGGVWVPTLGLFMTNGEAD